MLEEETTMRRRLAVIPKAADDRVMTTKRVNYRKLAFAHYEQLGQLVCAHCGFGIRDVLEVAHLDCDRCNNGIANLVILCPNCHKMHDLDLISTATIIEMRDRPKVAVWAKRMKDAGAKAADTRRERVLKLKWKNAGKKAAETRKRNAALADGTVVVDVRPGNRA
jgi:hypothetical protein